MKTMEMKKRRWHKAVNIALALALVLVVSLGIVALPMASQVGASPDEWYVDASVTPSGDGTSWGTAFKTITEGITAADTGDTILVAAGNYTENVDVDESLTLQGEGSAVVTVTAANSTYHVFEVTAANVTISGFTIQGATENGKAGIYVGNVGSCNITANACLDNYYGICLDNSDNNTLTSNTASSNTECGIYLDNSDNNTLTGNTASSNTKYGIYLDGTDGSHGNTLTGNTANQNGECGIYVDKSSNNTLTENTVSGNNGYGVNLDGSNNNALTSNLVTGNNIGVEIQGPVDASTITMNFNNIHGNTQYGVENSGSGTADATNNWWGANDGPDDDAEVINGSGDKISTNVGADPWLVLNVSANPTSIAVGGVTSTITADMTKNSDDVNPSAQDYIPDGTEVVFTTNLGTLGSSTVTKTTVSGIATATLTSSTESGIATVRATAGSDSSAIGVFFIAEGGAEVEDSKTKITSPGDDTIDAKDEADTEVTKSGDGTPIITVAKYESNPGGTAPSGFTAADEYIDVHIDSTEDVGQIEIKNYYTAAQVAGLVESSLTMRWWNGESWVQCSDSGLNTNDVNGYSGYVWAIITADTTPDLTALSGAVFGIIGTSPPTEGEEGEAEGEEGEAGGGGGALGYWVVIIDNLGKITEAKVSPSGELLESVRASDAEGQIALELDRGTKILCPGGKVPQRLEMKTIQILRPQDMVILGQVYRLDAYLYEYSPNPSLLTISPPGKLTLSYDLSELPPNSLAVFAAYYDTQKGWVELPSADITEVGKLTVEISGPMIFTLMVKLGPPPSLAEPGFRPSNLVIEPGEANPRQEISISLIVTNIGGAAGTCTLELKVDGVVRSVKSVSLEPGESEVVSFSITEDMEGKHMVEIADLKGDFSIVLIPFPWWLLSTAAIPPVFIILERRRRWKQRVAWSTGLKTKDWLVK